jgi:nitrogen fixation NifU-like protein
MNNLDAFTDKLQNEIFEDAIQAFGKKGFHRWRNIGNLFFSLLRK